MTIAMERRQLTEKADKAAADFQRLADVYNARQAEGKPEAERFTSEERTAYEQANADFDAAYTRLQELDREDHVAERANVIAAYRSEQANRNRREADAGARRSIPGRDEGPVGGSPREKDLSTEATEELRTLAFLGAMRRSLGEAPTRKQRDAAKRLGVRIEGGSLGFRLLDGEAFHEFRKSGEVRAITTTTGATLLAPATLVARVEEAMIAEGPMLQTSEVIRTEKGTELRIPTENDTASEGEIVGEGANVETDEDPDLDELVLNAFKFSSKRILVTPEQLTDSAFDIVGRIGRMIGSRWGRRQNKAYTIGTGTDEPQGIVPASTLGKTVASATAITGDEVLDLIASVDPAYQADPSFGLMMNPATLLLLRKLKDSNGQYLWGLGLNGVRSQVFAGVPCWPNRHMATAAASAKTIVAGALGKYVVRQVNGPRLRRLVELYAGTDREGFIGFLRADGDLLDAGTNPVKHLAQAAA